MLSKETQDQIRKEARDYAKIVVKGPTQWDDENIPKKTGYIAGAEVWAVWKEKAEAAREALEYFKDNCPEGSLFYKKAKSALEQFK